MRGRLIAFGLLFLPLTAFAEIQPDGFRFDLMPVGCLIHAKYNSGDQRIEVYAGKKAKGYITKSYAGPAKAGKLGNVINTITYNSSGYMVRKDWANGKWETFSPYSCFQLLGPCKYRYRNADGVDKVFIGSVTQSHGVLTSTGGWRGEAPFSPTTVKLGPFNNIASYSEGSTTYKVTKYENCGSVPGS